MHESRRMFDGGCPPHMPLADQTHAFKDEPADELFRLFGGQTSYPGLLPVSALSFGILRLLGDFQI